MKVLFNILYYVFLVAVLGVGLLLAGSLLPIPGNIEVKVVKSGSMEPSIHVGSIVIIKPGPSYQVGDVVTFGADTATQIPTTHRIIAVEGEGASRVFITKGDANDAPDPAQTRLTDIAGKMIVTVPYLGYVLDFAKKPMGFALLVGLPALVIIVEEAGKIVREIRVLVRRPSRQARAEADRKQTYASQEIPIKPQRRRFDQ